jgi:hypothetical protein
MGGNAPATTGAPVFGAGGTNANGTAAGQGQVNTKPTVVVDPGVAAALLVRMQALVDDVMAGKQPKEGGPVGTAGSFGGAGTIKMDRATLDELRSEIAQLRLMLQK